MKKCLSLLLLLLPFLSLHAVPAGNSDVADSSTYTFVSRNGKPLLMDVYRPRQPRADSACVVYMFGGGFVTGSRTDDAVRQYCKLLAQRGFVAVAIDYRLHLKEVDFDTVTLFKLQHVFRDAINIAANDASEAVAFICRHADEWGVARNRIVLAGGSAGAIAALQLDYCRANDLQPAAPLPDGWKPAAVVAYAGAVYCDGARPHFDSAPAPTFFLHGKKGKIVNYKKFPPLLRSGLYGPKKLHRLFEKDGYPHWFFRFEELGHEVASLHIYTIEEFEAFVNKSLTGSVMYYDADVRDKGLQPTKWTKMNVFDLYKGND